MREKEKKKNHTLWESTLNKAQNFNCEKQKLQEILRKWNKIKNKNKTLTLPKASSGLPTWGPVHKGSDAGEIGTTCSYLSYIPQTSFPLVFQLIINIPVSGPQNV